VTLASTIDRPRPAWVWLTKSGNRSARIPLELERPKQNNSASKIFDFPDPLGPEMTVNPGNKGTPVVPPKDLKFVSSTRLMYTRQPNRFGTKILQILILINNIGALPRNHICKIENWLEILKTRNPKDTSPV
jgi:hypothetical protein